MIVGKAKHRCTTERNEMTDAIDVDCECGWHYRFHALDTLRHPGDELLELLDALHDSYLLTRAHSTDDLTNASHSAQEAFSEGGFGERLSDQ
jgi:hypothetical protein